MTSVIIDRRPQTGKSAVNRQRVLRRLNKILKQQVDQLVDERSIKDIDQQAEVVVQKQDLQEPTFSIQQSSGSSDRVLPGNTRYRVGDLIDKPPSDGEGDGEGEEGEGEASEDSFRFMLSREEFLSLLFDDLELPELFKKEVTDVSEKKFKRGGIVRQGNPSSMSILRTFRASLGRRVAAAGAAAQDTERVEFAQADAQEVADEHQARHLAQELAAIRLRAAHTPFIDPVDLRHRSLVEVEAPRTAAVMFCLMDVSGSMDEDRKDLAKRFFTLLYLFLSRKYEKVELVFIRHTDKAEEVDENTFFYGLQTGGTRVLAALQKMRSIIDERYPPSRYNVFAAQASDGDSFGSDPAESLQYLQGELLPLVRYFVYAETSEDSNENTSLWHSYRHVVSDNFNMAAVRSRREVYPALVQLFKKITT